MVRHATDERVRFLAGIRARSDNGFEDFMERSCVLRAFQFSRFIKLAKTNFPAHGRFNSILIGKMTSPSILHFRLPTASNELLHTGIPKLPSKSFRGHRRRVRRLQRDCGTHADICALHRQRLPRPARYEQIDPLAMTARGSVFAGE